MRRPHSKMPVWLLLVVAMSHMTCCYGDEGPASQLVVLRQLPDNVDDPAGSHHFMIRTNFKGSVEFVEADDFHIEVNTTADSIEALARVHYNYTAFYGSVLLQLFEVDPVLTPFILDQPLIRYLLLALGGAVGVAFIAALFFVCWWHHFRRPLEEQKQAKVISPDSYVTDSSQAPLLEGRPSAEGQEAVSGARSRKRRKKAAPRGAPHGEEYISSEDDPDSMATRPTPHPPMPALGGHPSPRRHYAATMSPQKRPLMGSGPTSEVELYATVRKDRDSPNLISGVGSETLDSKGEIPPSKPVVSYIKIQGNGEQGPEGTMKKKSQYIPLSSGSDYSGDSNQTTLKIRRENSSDFVSGDPMPDVVRSRGYYPESRTDTAGRRPAGGGGRDGTSRYVPLAGGDGPEPKEPDYSTINKQLSGAHIATLLGDKNKGSPKFSHNTDRPPVTFGAPPNVPSYRNDRDMDRVELDSVGSSRSGESSVGGRTAGSYGAGGTDSDSTRSNSSSRGKDPAPAGYPANKVTMQGGRGNGQSAAVSEGGSNPRLVDEAYGTMGSNGNNTLRSSHSSTASTGSGSSGSVVTVIAADDPNIGSLGRRRKGLKGPDGGGNSGGGGGGGIGPHKYLHTSIVCGLCLISLATGVYGRMTRETTVHIRVFAPPGFLRYKPHVYFRTGVQVNVSAHFELHSLDVDKFGVGDSRIVDLGSNVCGSTKCPQGCDGNDGSCVCRQGYRLEKGYKCEDINECQQDLAECAVGSRCDNLAGSYRCMCTRGYYKDGNSCRECGQPCRNGTFEVMGCRGEHHKVCKECSRACMPGYFITAPCTPLKNTICKPCSQRCKRNQYEFTPCFGHTDRKCKDIDGLPQPGLSSNLIFEDMRGVRQALSFVLHQEEETLTNMFTMKRGSNYTVHVRVKQTNLAPLFRAVDHSASNDNDGFYGDERIRQNYCPQPVPEKYKLTRVLHQGVTTKAQYYSCQSRKRSAKSCDAETGFYLNPKESCQTYSSSPFGRLPVLNRDGWSILCAKPGKLSDVFEVSSQLNELTTMFVDKTSRCSEMRANCESCTQKCARNMLNYRGSHRCNITGEDSDNGESPRLPYCFSCCAQNECDKHCEVYHNPDCQQLRCVTGNLAEFVLSPSFSNRGIFACHIEPVPDYKIYDIEYTVRSAKGKDIVNRVLSATKVFDGKHPEKDSVMHGFLKVYYGSEVTSMPNIIEGDLSSTLHRFTTGKYDAKGESLEKVRFSGTSMVVRPKTPFSVSTKTWKREGCDTPAIKELVQPPTPPDSDFYKPNEQLGVHYMQNSQYRVYNISHLPFIYFEIPEKQSIFRSVFDETTLKDDSSLKAEIVREERGWKLQLRGQLSTCPGSFGLKVKDPAYPTQALFHYDIGVYCPNTFELDFNLPTLGPDIYDKKLQVEMEDSFRTVKLMVFRPAPNVTEDGKASTVLYTQKRETEMTIFTPFIAVLCVVITFLALLLLIGFITESVASRKIKKTENKVHSQHLLFVVCYVTFRAGYSIAVTFTVLTLLVQHSNRDSMRTLQEFHRYAESAENNQRLEIDKIQGFVMDELSRQNTLANHTKFDCEQKLLELQTVLEESKQQMRVESQEERLVSKVALQYTKLMILNLTISIDKFKEEFTGYAKKALDRLTRSIVQTSSALRSNKWLVGAKLIYDSVETRRNQQGQSTKPMEEWLGIEQEVERLAVDLSLQNFPTPNVTEFLKLDFPKTNTKPSSIPKISDLNLPRNQWYYQFEKKAGPPPNSLRSKRGSEFKVKGSDIISWSTLLAILVVIDIVWFVHRMAKTYSTAKMILYGCPSYVDCRKTVVESVSPSRKPAYKRSVSSRCLHFIKDLNLRVMKTEFVPKLVATATACCAIYLSLAASDQLLTVRTMASVGYFESLVAPVETSYRLARTRIKTNAYRINQFEYPFYEELVNVRTKRYQLMLEMYAELQKSNNVLHDSEYCAWKKMLNSGDTCNCTVAQAAELKFDGCELPPVSPHAYQRKDFGAYREQLSRSIVPYINSARQVVMDTCHLILIFVAVLVLVDALGAVTWIYLKRFNLLRLKPMYEIEQYPAPETMGNHT